MNDIIASTTDTTLPTPNFPPPTNAPTPRWATETTLWEAVAVDGIWIRDHKMVVDGFTVYQPEESSARDSITRPPIAVWPDFSNFDGTPEEVAAEARSLAASLMQIADALDGPRPVGKDGSAGETQRRLVQVIRNHIKALPIGQNEVAVAAGYGPDELSSFMTGKRLMDLTDVERIARALGADPFDLMSDLGR